jgi:hypothetical protein
MKESYCCPHCNQSSTRRWNLEIHIKRRHGGVGQAIRKMIHDSSELHGKPLSKNWRGDIYNKSKSTNNIFSTGLETQRFILESIRNMKEANDLCSQLYGQQAPGLINATQTMNGTTLGYKAYGCDKCLTFGFEQIFDHAKTSLKVNHICNPQRLYEAQFVRDIATTVQQRRQELILYLTFIVDQMFQQEPIDLVALEIPDYVFEKPISEEYVDLDSLSSGIDIDWAYNVAQGHKTKIDKIMLAQFLAIFNATLGFFRLKIDGAKRYFFTYIAKGLEPRDIKYLKNLYTANANISNGNGGNIHNHVSNIAWNDMVQFVDTPIANEPIPMLILDIFRTSVNFQ